MSTPLEEQHPSKRRRISPAQPSGPAEKLNTKTIPHSTVKKDSALDLKIPPFSPDLPAVALPAPTAGIPRTTPPRTPSPKGPFRWNHKFRPVPKSDKKDPPTPEINPFDTSITYPERLNLTQKLLDQALETAKAEIEEQKKVIKVMKKELDEANKEAVEAKTEAVDVKRQLAELMAHQALRDDDHAAAKNNGRAFISMPTGDPWVLPPVQW